MIIIVIIDRTGEKFPLKLQEIFTCRNIRLNKTKTSNIKQNAKEKLNKRERNK